MIALIIVLAVLWFAVGFASFVHWWRMDYDFTTSMIPLACLAGLIGPLSYLGGMVIHGNSDKRPSKVLLPKRD